VRVAASLAALQVWLLVGEVASGQDVPTPRLTASYVVALKLTTRLSALPQLLTVKLTALIPDPTLPDENRLVALVLGAASVHPALGPLKRLPS